MASELHHLVHRQPEVLLELEPEELAGPVLRWLVKQEALPARQPQARGFLLSQFVRASEGVRKALTEAWVPPGQTGAGDGTCPGTGHGAV